MFIHVYIVYIIVYVPLLNVESRNLEHRNHHVGATPVPALLSVSVTAEEYGH